MVTTKNITGPAAAAHPLPGLINTNRIISIDILRGLVMVIMALDHTREFFHISAMTANPLDPATTTIPLFFTRWITHFCAPVFVFLSGLSIYLSSQNKSKKQVSAFLLKRGAWLVFAEVVLVTLGLSFNPFYNFIILQVIWAIGCSMILLGFFIRGSYKLILIAGILLVAFHNLFDLFALPQTGVLATIIKIFFTSFGTMIPLGKEHLVGVFYAVLPWTGIMFLGYATGAWYRKDFDSRQRKHHLLICGFLLIGLFIVLRTLNGYGDPAPRQHYPQLLQNFLSFLNASKYPPSLLYTCMTLGPALLFLAVTEKASNWLTRVLAVYGSVPFFYYLLHFYLLHTLLVIAFFATGHTSNQIGAFPQPFFFRPNNFGFSLIVVYLIWLSVVSLLYLPCRWYKQFKFSHNNWWLKYL